MLNNALLAAGSAQELVIHPWLILPFVLLLLSIALIPLINSKWWEKYYWLVSVGLGAFVLCYYLFIFKAPVKMLHVAHEYISFIVLIGSLFVVSGGIHISTKGQAKPLINCIFLFAGSILANLVGTTGASMLMIRPWIRMNRRRITGFHIVFFIFDGVDAFLFVHGREKREKTRFLASSRTYIALYSRWRIFCGEKW